MSLRSLQEQAYAAVRKAVLDGRLVRPSACPTCKADPPLNEDGLPLLVQFHHTHGYAQENWLVGEWLCPSCHTKTHFGNEIVTPDRFAEIDAAVAKTLAEIKERRSSTERLDREHLRSSGFPDSLVAAVERNAAIGKIIEMEKAVLKHGASKAVIEYVITMMSSFPKIVWADRDKLRRCAISDEDYAIQTSSPWFVPGAMDLGIRRKREAKARARKNR